MLESYAEIFKALGDPTRLRLAVILAASGESCVCHLAAALDEPDYKASRHLGVLRSAGLATARREGTWMHYSLNDGANPQAGQIAGLLRALAADDPRFAADSKRLAKSCCPTAAK